MILDFILYWCRKKIEVTTGNRHNKNTSVIKLTSENEDYVQ